MLVHQDALQFPDFLERFTGEQLARGVDGTGPLLFAETPERVEVLQGKAQGSIRAWQEAQVAWLRCRTIDSRTDGVRPEIFLPASSSDGIFGGGGAGGEPRMLSRMNKPRFTGEVRSGLEVTARTVPCVKMPPRGLPAGRSTRRIWSPLTPSIP